LIDLKIGLRRCCVYLQTVVDLVAEVGQKRRYIRIAGEQSIFLNTFVGFVIGPLAFGNIARKRREQCRRIALLDEIPEVEQPCGTAISIKIPVKYTLCSSMIL